MFRKAIFWLHLGTGIAVGLVVAMMSLTGVLLTYEHQLVAWADARSWPQVRRGTQRLPISDLIAIAKDAGVKPGRVTIYRDVKAPVLVGGGRRDPSTFMDAYSGTVLGQPANSMRDAMRSLTMWHRWFAASGESRATGRLVTGVSNLAFLFLIVSGAYLWLPKVFKWPLFRQRLRFAKRYRNTKERDFYWHHVFATWSIVPLVVIVTTAVVISFPWANNLLTGMAGDGPGRPASTSVATATTEANRLNLDELLTHAISLSSGWNSIALLVPERNSPVVTFEVNKGTGRQPHKIETLILDASSGALVDTVQFSDRPPARRALFWNRFLHTGESFGFVGQTIAGLASLASLIMVWTGFALAWRRLIVPLFRGR